MNVILFDTMPADDVIARDDYRYEHIVKVLHLGVGDMFQMGIVNGAKGEATIVSLDDSGCRFAFKETEKDASSLYPVTLLIGQVRPICMRRILREAVDLGVETMVLSTCDLTERSYQDAKLYTSGEYRSILLDGAMQSGKTGLSEVRFASSIDEALTKVPSGAQKILLDNVIGKDSLSSLAVTEKRVVLAIGPERGFSDRERKLFLDAGYDCRLMGSRILRTETVCSAATALLLSRMGLL
jgi:16S rRNA (uracil1498-N3)-methyltransferase